MATKNIKDFHRGDTKTWKFQFGNGVDITGWKIYFTMKVNKEDDDSEAVLQVIATAGDNVLDDVFNGLMFVTATSADTSTIEVSNNKYWYGYQRVISGSPPDVKTLHTGSVKVLQDITITAT